MKTSFAIAGILTTLACGHAFGGEIGFSSPPSAKRVGEKVVISFAVKSETDAAVFIEDSKGKIVRHLVAGVLGKKPPKPFKPGLSQTVEWDGRADYGKAAGTGPFKVRVALGLGARYEKVVQGNRPFVRGAMSLAAHGKSVYVLARTGTRVWGGDANLIEFSPDGTYRRTLKPFPSHLPFERVKSFGAVNLDGRPMPAMSSQYHGLYVVNSLGTAMTVSADGKHVVWLRGSYIACVDRDGGTDRYVTRLSVPDDKGKLQRVFSAGSGQAFSPDGKHLYLCGVRTGKKKANRLHHAIYKVSFPARNTGKLFFGDPKTAGKDKEHLGSPRALATDGRGHLLVTDYGNNRVVVLSEKTGKFVSEFAVRCPQAICVDRKTGAVYVSSAKSNAKAINLIKYESLAKPTKVCASKVTVTGWNNSHSIAVARGKDGNPILWLATKDGAIAILQDLGAKFSDGRFISRSNRCPVKKGGPKNAAYVETYYNVVVDRQRKEVYACVGIGGRRWMRYSEVEDKVDHLSWNRSQTGSMGLGIVPGKDGHLYSLSWPYSFARWDRNGRPLAFEHRKVPTKQTMLDYGVNKFSKGPKNIALIARKKNCQFVPVAMTEIPHTLGMRWSDGHVFILAQTYRERNPKVLWEFHPNGKLLSEKPIIWHVSDMAVGPRFDAAGNIYIADAIKPQGWNIPKDLARAFKDGGIKNPDFTVNGHRHPDRRVRMAVYSYGSIVKFSPKGGMINYQKSGSSACRTAKAFGTKALPAKPDLPKDMKRIQAFYTKGPPWPNKPYKVTTIGAEWIHAGMGQMGPWRCNCASTSFDVDEFGRSFFPDINLFRIRVIDTAGNAVTHIGSYGNADCCGPDSPVIDPKTGELRPKKPGEKLESPFAKPDIGLAWPMAVGVTDKFAYIGDPVNRRLLKVKLTYAAEKTCAIGSAGQSSAPAVKFHALASPKKEDSPPAAKSPARIASGRTAEQVCTGWFSAAKNYRRLGMKKDARRCLNNIVKAYPAGKWAERARAELARL